MHVRAAVLSSLILSMVLSSTLARDRNQDQDIPDRPSESPPQVVEARSKADTAYERGDYAKVVELATWLIENYPTDNVHVAYYLRASGKVELGRIAGSAKQVREGIADARQAILLAGNEYPWVHIPYLYGLTSLAEIERRADHADLAIKIVTPVLQLPESKGFTAEDRANLYYQRGLAYAARGDFKLAANDHAQAIKLSPQHLGSHIKRAEVLASLGQNKETLAAYDQAVERFPNVLVVTNDRGKLKRSMGDLDGAIADFTRCLALDPTSGVCYVNRGLCLVEQNSSQAAEGDFSEALKFKLDPNTNVLAFRLRSAARLVQGRAAEAVSDLNAAIKINPKEATLFEERGCANVFQKDYAAAKSDFAKTLQLNPKLTHVLPWQWIAMSRSGMTSEARALLESAVGAKTPPAGWTAKLCAFLLDQANEQELFEAASSGTNTKEKSRQGCEARYFAGQKLLAKDDAPKAAELFRDAVAAKEYSLSAYRGACFELGEFK
jgi:tetratricopeptide (TPR) repeat protein